MRSLVTLEMTNSKLEIENLILMLICFLLLLSFSLLAPVSHASVRINEVYPAPQSGEQEWIELYNDQETETNLGGFTLTDEKNNNITIPPSSLPPFGFIAVTSTNILNNDGDSLTLKTSDGTLVDTMTYQSSPGSSRSYQYCDSWQVGEPPTRETANICTLPTDTPAPTETPLPVTPTQTIAPISNTPTPTKPPVTNITINEIMGNPETGVDEWIELYNNNNFSVELNSWYLDDEEEGGSSPKKFSLTVAAKSYGVIELSSAMINNSGDSVRVLDEQKHTLDEVEYEETEKNTTWSRSLNNNHLFCKQTPTKSSENKICISTVAPTIYPTISPTQAVPPSPTLIEEAEPSVTEILDEEYIPFVNRNKQGKKTAPGTSTKSAVLGITEHNAHPKTILILLFSAAFFSILTIISVLFKMKTALRS